MPQVAIRGFTNGKLLLHLKYFVKKKKMRNAFHLFNVSKERQRRESPRRLFFFWFIDLNIFTKFKLQSRRYGHDEKSSPVAHRGGEARLDDDLRIAMSCRFWPFWRCQKLPESDWLATTVAPTLPLLVRQKNRKIKSTHVSENISKRQQWLGNNDDNKN